MNLERVDEVRSAELNLPVGSILLNQMECIIEVLMKFEPSLQLKTQTTPGNQESFATRPTTSNPTDEEYAEYLTSLQALAQDEIVEIDAVEKKNTKLQFRAESHQSTCNCRMSKLDCIAHQTRHCMGYELSSKFDCTAHDPDTCFIRVTHICQYLHYTLGYALRYVPIPPQSKHKLWVLGDATFAPTEEKSQQGLIVYHGITSNQRKGGNLVQWRSGRQDLIAKSTCEAELITSSEALQQGENIAIVVAEVTNKSCEIEVLSDNAASLHMIRNGSETAWRTRHINVKALWLHQMARRGIKFTNQSTTEMAADSLTKGLGASRLPQFEKTSVALKTSMSRSCSEWFLQHHQLVL